jgi:hypothetical protein
MPDFHPKQSVGVSLLPKFAGKFSLFASNLNLAHRAFKMGGVLVAGFRNRANRPRQGSERSGK